MYSSWEIRSTPDPNVYSLQDIGCAKDPTILLLASGRPRCKSLDMPDPRQVKWIGSARRHNVVDLQCGALHPGGTRDSAAASVWPGSRACWCRGMCECVTTLLGRFLTVKKQHMMLLERKQLYGHVVHIFLYEFVSPPAASSSPDLMMIEIPSIPTHSLAQFEQ